MNTFLKIITNFFGNIFMLFLMAFALNGCSFSTEIEKNLKIIEQVQITLEMEKINNRVYAKTLIELKENNPLMKTPIKDYWGNEFFYQQKENGKDYILISKGKDGIISTIDDMQ